MIDAENRQRRMTFFRDILLRWTRSGRVSVDANRIPLFRITLWSLFCIPLPGYRRVILGEGVIAGLGMRSASSNGGSIQPSLPATVSRRLAIRQPSAVSLCWSW